MSTGTGAALGAVAPQLGAREPQLVAQRHGQRFLLHDVHAPHLSVDVQRDQTLDRAGSRGLAEERAGAAEEIGGGGRRRAGRDDSFDEGAPCDRIHRSGL